MEEHSHPLDVDVRSGAPWPAIAALYLGVLGLVTTGFCLPALLAPTSRALAVSAAEAAGLVAAAALAAILSGPAIVLSAWRLDRRAGAVAVTLCLAISCLLAAVASGVAALFVSSVLLGLGLGGCWAMSIALAARWRHGAGTPSGSPGQTAERAD